MSVCQHHITKNSLTTSIPVKELAKQVFCWMLSDKILSLSISPL